MLIPVQVLRLKIFTPILMKRPTKIPPKAQSDQEENNFESTNSTEGKVGADKDRACVEYLRWDGGLEEIL